MFIEFIESYVDILTLLINVDISISIVQYYAALVADNKLVEKEL